MNRQLYNQQGERIYTESQVEQIVRREYYNNRSEFEEYLIYKKDNDEFMNVLRYIVGVVSGVVLAVVYITFKTVIG